jgi:hypothetical protein
MITAVIFDYFILQEQNAPVIDYFTYMGVIALFTIFSYYFYFIKKGLTKYWDAILYSIIAVVASAIGEQGNGMGLAFLLLAIHILDNLKLSMFIIASSVVAIGIKFWVKEYNMFNLINMYLVYVIVLLGYYSYVYPKRAVTIKTPELSFVEKQVLEYHIAGYSSKMISAKLLTHLTEGDVDIIIQHIMDTFSCETQMELAHKLTKWKYL